MIQGSSTTPDDDGATSGEMRVIGLTQAVAPKAREPRVSERRVWSPGPWGFSAGVIIVALDIFQALVGHGKFLVANRLGASLLLITPARLLSRDASSVDWHRDSIELVVSVVAVLLILRAASQKKTAMLLRWIFLAALFIQVLAHVLPSSYQARAKFAAVLVSLAVGGLVGISLLPRKHKSSTGILRSAWLVPAALVVLAGVLVSEGASTVSLPPSVPQQLGASNFTNTGTASGTMIGSDVLIRSGPQTDFSAVGRAGDGMQVRIVCTAYGDQVGDDHQALWDYVSTGWIADHFINTGSSKPVAPACGGKSGHPSVTSSAASLGSGPYALLTGSGSTAVFASPGGARSAAYPDGYLIRVGCLVNGPSVRGPRITSTQWVRLSGGRYAPLADLDSASQLSQC